jgi:PAS domain-containing protein
LQVDDTSASARQASVIDAVDHLTMMGLQIIGRDWRYVYVSRAAAAHGRRQAGELEGEPMTDAYPGIDRTPMFERLQACMVSRAICVFDNLFTFPDGEQRWFEIRVEPVPEGICVYSMDIHERKLQQLALAAELEERRAAQPRGWLDRLLGRGKQKAVGGRQ